MRLMVDVLTRGMELVAPEEVTAGLLQDALDRQAIVAGWEQALADGGAEATRRYLAQLRRRGRRVGRSTLYLWRRILRREGVAGLVDGRGPRTAKLDRALRQYLAAGLRRLEGADLALAAMWIGTLAKRRAHGAAVRAGKAAQVPTRRRRADRAAAIAVPAPGPARWLIAAEVATLLGQSARHVRRRCLQWAEAGLARKRRQPGSKAVWEIWVNQRPRVAPAPASLSRSSALPVATGLLDGAFQTACAGRSKRVRRVKEPA